MDAIKHRFFYTVATVSIVIVFAAGFAGCATAPKTTQRSDKLERIEKGDVHSLSYNG